MMMEQQSLNQWNVGINYMAHFSNIALVEIVSN